MAANPLAEQLDAVLSGRVWEVQEKYDTAPEPCHPVRVQKTAYCIVLAVLDNAARFLIMSPESENRHSHGTVVTGVVRYLCARYAKIHMSVHALTCRL
uniref:Uncharacterized protein n=1 Tax=Gopherus evgoodei TaxID=1825980 RepID=A0A8C4WI10_9SAUR